MSRAYELAQILEDKAAGKKNSVGDLWSDSVCAEAAAELRRLASMEAAYLALKPAADVPLFRADVSPIHGTGLFATRLVARGTPLGLYTGDRFACWDLAPKAVEDEPTTYYWLLSSGEVIIGTSQLRLLNHSCDPNVRCEEAVIDGRLEVQFFARRTSGVGTELTLDYRLQKDASDTGYYACRCGSRFCRGTMLEVVPRRGQIMRRIK